MLSETGKKWKGLAAGLATATVAAAFGATSADPVVIPDDDNERPPIIVNNGSLEFEGDNGFLGLKDGGKWEGSGAVYKHVHGNAGPRFLQLKTSPNKKFCTVTGAAEPEVSPFIGSKVAITFGTSTQKWTATASIITEKTVNYLQLNFGNKPPTVEHDNKRLTVADSERIYSVSIDDGAVTCTFPSGDNDPKVNLKIRQKR
jgi:hypothetical protein